MKNAIILGLDGGFSSIGYAALRMAPPPSSNLSVTELGVFETQKASKKAHVLATEDNLKRAREIAVFLDKWFQSHDDQNNRVVCLACESMSWPRNASVTGKLGIYWGVVAAVALRHQIPIFQASPQAVKMCTTGSKSASKEEVQSGVIARVKGNLSRQIHRLSKGRHEHVSDAVAIALTVANAEAVQVARRSLA